MSEYVVAVDGGNSKTDVVIVNTAGKLLARVRGPGVSSPLQDPGTWRKGLTSLVDEARAQAGISLTSKATCAVYYLANVDLLSERRVAQRELDAAGLATLTVVQNDSLAVLRAGTTHGWGIAVVAGAGINAVGVHPSGKVAGFRSLGDYTGDAGGGQYIGLQGLIAAVRAQDGRGPATSLTKSVPSHFGLRTADDVAIAVHHDEIEYEELLVLAPLVFAAAKAGDEVALRIITAFADEVALMAITLIRRLHLVRTDVEVVLGGGTLQTGYARLFDRVNAQVLASVPQATVSVLDVSPVFGAVVEAFDRIGAGEPALRTARAVFGTA